MSRTMPHNAWLFSIVLVSLASAGAVHAATETVTLKNGKTYEVETDRRGELVGAENRQVEMTHLGVISYSSPSSDSPVYEWMLSARLKRRGAFKVTVTTPIDETVSTSFEVVGRGEVSQQFFNSEEYAALWVWLNEPETTWIPFVFSFEDTESGNTFELTQWTRFEAPGKEAFVRSAYRTAGLTPPDEQLSSETDRQTTAGLQTAGSLDSEATPELLAETTQPVYINEVALLDIFRGNSNRRRNRALRELGSRIRNTAAGRLILNQIYDEDLDRGFAEFSDDFGLTGVYFSHGSTSGFATQSLDRRAELEESLTNFWMPTIFLARTGDASVLHKEFVSVGDEEMLFAIVNISHGSGAWNMVTNEVFDAKVGALLFGRGEYGFVLSAQDNIGDSQYGPGEDLTSEDLASIAESSMRDLENLYHSFRFE